MNNYRRIYEKLEIGNYKNKKSINILPSFEFRVSVQAITIQIEIFQPVRLNQKFFVGWVERQKEGGFRCFNLILLTSHNMPTMCNKRNPSD